MTVAPVRRVFSIIFVLSVASNAYGAPPSEAVAELSQKEGLLKPKCLNDKEESACDELELLYDAAEQREAALSLNRCDAVRPPSDFRNALKCLRKARSLQALGRSAEHLKLLEQLCVAGHSRQCHELAMIQHSTDPAKAFQSIEKGCKDGAAAACGRRDVWLFKRPKVELEEYLVKSCEGAFAYDCLNYALFLKHEEKESEFPLAFQKAARMYADKCVASPEPDACGMHAVLLCFDGKVEEGKKKFAELCDEGKKDACKVVEQGLCEKAKDIVMQDFARKFLAH